MTKLESVQKKREKVFWCIKKLSLTAQRFHKSQSSKGVRTVTP